MQRKVLTNTEDPFKTTLAANFVHLHCTVRYYTVD